MNKFKKKDFNAKVDGMFNLRADIYEQMTYLRQLHLEKEKLEEKIANVKHECDVFKEVLTCTTRDEIETLIDEFLPHQSPPTSSDEVESFVQNVSFHKNYIVQKSFGATVRRVDKNGIMVEFRHPPDFKPSRVSLVKLVTVGKMYRLDHFILPPVIPVSQLKEKYLDPKTQDVPSFINSIQQCLWYYCKRDIEIKKLKTEDFMTNSIVYHNEDRTVIAFTLHLKDKFTVEISLRFKPLSIIAESVECREWDDLRLDSDVVESLEVLKEALLLLPLSDVMHTSLASSSSSDEGDGEERDRDRDAEDTDTVTSDDTVVFDLFKM